MPKQQFHEVKIVTTEQLPELIKTYSLEGWAVRQIFQEQTTPHRYVVFAQREIGIANARKEWRESQASVPRMGGGK